MGNEGICSVGKEFGKALYLFAKQRVLWVPREMAFLILYGKKKKKKSSIEAFASILGES